MIECNGVKCMFDKDLFLSLCEKYDVKFSETANDSIICEHDKKIVQHIKIDMIGFPKQGLYCYGEASFEANQAMQEPLEKLYKYENQPNMREKVREYISELDAEIERCVDEAESILAAIGDYDENPMPTNYIRLEERTKVLGEVKNDLQGRLDELI